MSTRHQWITTTADIVREYGLREHLAREIVNEETSLALRRSIVAWFVLLTGLISTVWLHLESDLGLSFAAWVPGATVVVWYVIGRYIAGAAIRKAASDKAQRIRSYDG